MYLSPMAYIISNSIRDYIIQNDFKSSQTNYSGLLTIDVLYGFLTCDYFRLDREKKSPNTIKNNVLKISSGRLSSGDVSCTRSMLALGQLCTRFDLFFRGRRKRDGGNRRAPELGACGTGRRRCPHVHHDRVSAPSFQVNNPM